MKHPLILAVVILTASLVGQVEHAPTVAQCQADQRLWMSKIEEREASSRSNLPGFDVLSQWGNEMDDCEKVDSDNKWKYYNTSGEIDEEKLTRMVDFLDRHGLWAKFKDEDAVGKR